jgi:hypothetical protein
MSNQVMVCGALSDNRSTCCTTTTTSTCRRPRSSPTSRRRSALRIKCTAAPRDFRVDYVGYDGTEIHIDWKGLMDPVRHPRSRSTARRPALSRTCTPTSRSAKKHKAGHFDLTGHATGTLTVRGKTFAVDSIERMDHSWGPRDPMGIKNMYIVRPRSGPISLPHDLPLEPGPQGSAQFQLTHGYVLDHGEVHGLTSKVTMTSVHHG